MKKLSLLLLLTSMFLVGCTGNSSGNNSGNNGGDTPVNPSGGDGGDDTPVVDPTVTITVNFYQDYNQVAAKNVYMSMGVANGSKLTKPADPTTSNYPEFPVFKGWSKKEVIDDVKDLWNFDTDVVAVTSGKTLNLYGIWVAKGEQFTSLLFK